MLIGVGQVAALVAADGAAAVGQADALGEAFAVAAAAAPAGVCDGQHLDQDSAAAVCLVAMQQHKPSVLLEAEHCQELVFGAYAALILVLCWEPHRAAAAHCSLQLPLVALQPLVVAKKDDASIDHQAAALDAESGCGQLHQQGCTGKVCHHGWHLQLPCV